MKCLLDFKNRLRRVSVTTWAMVLGGVLFICGAVATTNAVMASGLCMSSLLWNRPGPAEHSGNDFSIRYPAGWYEDSCAYFGQPNPEATDTYDVVSGPIPLLVKFDRIWGTSWGAESTFTTDPTGTMSVTIAPNSLHQNLNQIQQQYTHPSGPPTYPTSTFYHRQVLGHDALVISTKAYATNSSTMLEQVYVIIDQKLIDFRFFATVQDPKNPHTGRTRDAYVAAHHAVFDSFVGSFQLK